MYIPLYIIVMSSWVTFWLVKTEKGQETPARTQLGATTVLAVVTIGFGGKAKPQESLSINVILLHQTCKIAKYCAGWICHGAGCLYHHLLYVSLYCPY